eukprot:Gb_41714 [translate_table: standard]
MGDIVTAAAMAQGVEMCSKIPSIHRDWAVSSVSAPQLMTKQAVTVGTADHMMGNTCYGKQANKNEISFPEKISELQTPFSSCLAAVLPYKMISDMRGSNGILKQTFSNLDVTLERHSKENGQVPMSNLRSTVEDTEGTYENRQMVGSIKQAMVENSVFILSSLGQRKLRTNPAKVSDQVSLVPMGGEAHHVVSHSHQMFTTVDTKAVEENYQSLNSCAHEGGAGIAAFAKLQCVEHPRLESNDNPVTSGRTASLEVANDIEPSMGILDGQVSCQKTCHPSSQRTRSSSPQHHSSASHSGDSFSPTFSVVSSSGSETHTQDKSLRITVKATYKDDKVRFKLPLALGFFKLCEEIVKRFKVDLGTFHLKYLDDDEEWVLMASDADLHECIDILNKCNGHIIKLLVCDVALNIGSSSGSTCGL